MEKPPKVGTQFTRRFAVATEHTIDLAPGVCSPVLSTPSLIWFLEHTALELMQPHLQDGEITVGVQVDVEHLAPTPPGDEVTCSARVVHSDGPIVTFQLEAYDSHDQIAKGLHKRRVLHAVRLGKRVEQKRRAERHG